MKRFERTIRYLDLNLSAYPDTRLAPQFDLATLLRDAQQRLRQGDLQRRPKEGAAHHIRIRDIRFTKSGRFAVVLFSLADKDTVDATYENVVSGDMRTFTKDEEEGTRFSAHLVIRLEPNDVQVHRVRYLALLEETRGLAPSAIGQHLRSAIKRVGQAEYTNEDQEVRECFPLINLEGHLSSPLLEQLRTGQLDGFTLIKTNELANDGIDEADLVSTKDYQLRLDVVAANWLDRLREIFTTVWQRARAEQFSEIRVRYSNRDGRPKTLPISVDQTDALESLTVRSTKLILDNPMDYKQVRVDFDFAKQVFKLARDER